MPTWCLFDSAEQWRRVVPDGLATDDVDVGLTYQIIIIIIAVL